MHLPNEMTYPTHFSHCILVKFKLDGFEKWLKLLFPIICKSLYSLTRTVAGITSINRLVVNMVVFDDVNVYNKLVTERDSSSLMA